MLNTDEKPDSLAFPTDQEGIFWAARNRILLWYGLLLALIFVAVIPAF